MEEKRLKCGFPVNEKRVLTVILRPENGAFFEGLSFEKTIAYMQKLDDAYYATIPTVEEMAKIYGDYSARDLYLSYQWRCISDNQIEMYDINDERQRFSRRF